MKKPLSSLPTYVYIDGSNIRFACKNGLGFDLDYKKLFGYLSAKYTNLKRVAYLEGRSSDDAEKLNILPTYRYWHYTR